MMISSWWNGCQSIDGTSGNTAMLKQTKFPSRLSRFSQISLRTGASNDGIELECKQEKHATAAMELIAEEQFHQIASSFHPTGCGRRCCSPISFCRRERKCRNGWKVWEKVSQSDFYCFLEERGTTEHFPHLFNKIEKNGNIFGLCPFIDCILLDKYLTSLKGDFQLKGFQRLWSWNTSMG